MLFIANIGFEYFELLELSHVIFKSLIFVDQKYTDFILELTLLHLGPLDLTLGSA